LDEVTVTVSTAARAGVAWASCIGCTSLECISGTIVIALAVCRLMVKPVPLRRRTKAASVESSPFTPRVRTPLMASPETTSETPVCFV
jgi:hypothetical protein